LPGLNFLSSSAIVYNPTTPIPRPRRNKVVVSATQEARGDASQHHNKILEPPLEHPHLLSQLLAIDLKKKCHFLPKDTIAASFLSLPLLQEKTLFAWDQAAAELLGATFFLKVSSWSPLCVPVDGCLFAMVVKLPGGDLGEVQHICWCAGPISMVSIRLLMNSHQ
jgi:hypothetical protein